MFGERRCTQDKHRGIVKLWVHSDEEEDDDGMWGWAMKWGERVVVVVEGGGLTTGLYWCESVIHWVCKSRGNATLVQHVRVIPARLLNLDSQNVTLYGYFSAAEHKAFWHFCAQSFRDPRRCFRKTDALKAESVERITSEGVCFSFILRRGWRSVFVWKEFVLPHEIGTPGHGSVRDYTFPSVDWRTSHLTEVWMASKHSVNQ